MINKNAEILDFMHYKKFLDRFFLRYYFQTVSTFNWQSCGGVLAFFQIKKSHVLLGKSDNLEILLTFN